MSALTHWRRQANRYGRDLVRATPGGVVGLVAAAAGVGAFLYMRKNQFRVGQIVRVLDQKIGGVPVTVDPRAVVVRDASLLVGSFGVDGGVSISPVPGDASSLAFFAAVFPGQAVVDVNGSSLAHGA